MTIFSKFYLDNSSTISCDCPAHSTELKFPPLELIAEDMRSALSDIAELDGTQATPDIMTAIFSRFCIGK